MVSFVIVGDVRSLNIQIYTFKLIYPRLRVVITKLKHDIQEAYSLKRVVIFQEWQKLGLPLSTTSNEACKLYDATLTQVSTAWYH